MCLRHCTVAIAFSSLRATSVSSCAGAAPGSAALTRTLGKSMSGKFCTFLARNASKPANVRSTKNNTAGIGLRIDQDETFRTAPSPRGRGGRRAVRHAHQVAVVEEAGTRRDHARVRCDPL